MISMPSSLILIFLGVSNNSHSNIILSRIAVLHTLAHTATLHLVTYKRHTLIQAAADLYTYLCSSIYTAALQQLTLEYYI